MNGGRWSPAALAAGGLLFVVLVTSNGAGYRYGASDQAFHIPAAVHLLDPATFPRDAALLDSQGRLMLFDDLVAGLVRTTGLSLEAVFFAGYLCTTLLIWLGAVLIGQRVLGSPWAVAALAAAMTLRHRIPRTSVNSMEPYFYPRTLAFACGLLALAALVRRRWVVAAVLLVAAAAAHITTGAWFAVLAGAAWLTLEPRLRHHVPALLALAVVAVIAMVLANQVLPFATRFDAAWLEGMGARDSTFPTDWPWWAWALNLGLPVWLWFVHRQRRRQGTATPVDQALAVGAFTLAGLFLVTLPFVTMRWALPTQLQISRVFWLVEFVALLYTLALVHERFPAGVRAARMRAVAIALLALAASRGAYVMLHERPNRALFQVQLRPSAWTEAMHWLARQPADVHVLAHPRHATLYGSSVRVAARRDVVLEEVKDSSVALYSRDVALRVAHRRADIGPAFDMLTAPEARRLARVYQVDYLVSAGAPLAFPVVFANDRFRIYDVRTKPR